MSLIDKIWFQKHPLRWVLLPFSALFYVVVQLRKMLFALGLKSTSHPGVPVLVVGNITVGGNGKTPVVLKTVQWLVELGYTPGILSRGYGGKCESYPHRVNLSDSAEFVGDEPMLMSRRKLCPVVIDPQRPRGAKALVEEGCDVIVCDDGLQHYALGRDIEWVVMDDRAIGNGRYLPAGPLREGRSRLEHVNAIIHNGKIKWANSAFSMTLSPTRFINVSDPTKSQCATEFVKNVAQQPVNAMAGIGAPQRFFDTLESLGFTQLNTKAFIDHHQFSPADIPSGVTLMTEKDAVKCAPFAHEDCWYLEVDATLPIQLKEQLSQQIRSAAQSMSGK